MLLVAAPIEAVSQSPTSCVVKDSGTDADRTGDDDDESPTAPIACGRGAPLLTALDRDRRFVTVRFQGGATQQYYPVMMTNKPDFKCMKLKLTLGCVVATRQDGTDTIVTLRTSTHRTEFTEESIRVTADRRVLYAGTAQYFVLLPRRPAPDKESFGARALRVAAAYQCESDTGAKRCAELKSFIAERTLFNSIRREQLLPRKSAADRQTDAEHLHANYRALTGTQRALNQMIVANEIGSSRPTEAPYVSPFQVVDALDGSGPSFGAHQVDIGTNKEEGVKVPFMNASKALAAGAQDAFARNALTSGGEIFSRPVRQFDLRTIRTFWRLEPAFYREMRSPERRTDYYSVYDRFLKQRGDCINSLRQQSAYFRARPWAALYVIDVAHQYGPGRAVRLARFTRSLERDGRTPSVIDDAIETYMKTGGRQEPAANRFSPRDNSEIERRIGHANAAVANIALDTAMRRRCPAPWLGDLANL